MLGLVEQQMDATDQMDVFLFVPPPFSFPPSSLPLSPSPLPFPPPLSKNQFIKSHLGNFECHSPFIIVPPAQIVRSKHVPLPLKTRRCLFGLAFLGMCSWGWISIAQGTHSLVILDFLLHLLVLHFL